jgi:hypothetical protein
VVFVPIFSAITSGALYLGFLARLRDVARATVIGREREQWTIAFAELSVAEVCGHQLIHVLCSGVDVRLDKMNVTDLHLLARRRHKLHHAYRAYLALRVLSRWFSILIGDQRGLSFAVSRPIVNSTQTAVDCCERFFFMAVALNLFPSDK